MENWKTTAGAVIGAIGLALSQINEPEWVSWLGKGLILIGTLFFGYNAKDK